jgi:hypothetical protein
MNPSCVKIKKILSVLYASSANRYKRSLAEKYLKEVRNLTFFFKNYL